MTHFNTIILGAGAAGLMAAIEAGKRGLSVLVIDHAKTSGKKLLVSGGGKCNVTNRHISWKDYVGENPAFCKTAIQRFRIENILQLLEDARIDIEEREHGRIFCQQGAKKLVDYLEQSARRHGAEFLLGTNILSTSKQGDIFHISTSATTYTALNLLVSTGGLAWPQIGATDIGHKIAKQFRHKIFPARPALVGLKLDKASPLLQMQGISLPVEAFILKDICAAEPLLFTHKGISGPAVFQLSCYWKKGDAITINFLPEENAAVLMHQPENGKLLVKTLFAHLLPERLLQAILPPELAIKKVAILNKKERGNIADCIHAFQETPIGTEDFSKAETTRGGISTEQLNPKSMESLLTPGLFFAGEVVDIAGKLGGYNIHWAFSSGFLAGRAFYAKET